MHSLLLIVALLAQVNVPKAPPPIRRVLTEGKQYALNKDGLCLALQDAHRIAKEGGDPGLTFWVVAPPWSDPKSAFEQVSQVNNSTITRTSNRIRPRLLLDEKTGACVIATDLERLATTPKQVAELKALHEKLAPFDSYFNQEVIITHDAVIPIDTSYQPGQEVEIKLKDGTWGKASFKGKEGSLLIVLFKGVPTKCSLGNVRPIQVEVVVKPAVRTFTAEAYLNPEGAELFNLTHSNVPIMRLEEYITFGMSSVDGGQYYERLGAEKDLADTVAKFAGFEAARKVQRVADSLKLAQEIQKKEGGKRSILEIAIEFDQELAKSKAVIRKSNVTKRQRLCLFVTGSNLAPTEGQQVVAVTFDISQDNTSPASDPNRNLEIFETYNGGEAIFPMPNGMLAYLVFDAKDKLIASVPDNVAYNSEAAKIRADAGTARVDTMACCICHDSVPKNWGWQPVRNDVHESLRGLTHLLSDAKIGTPRHDNLLKMQRLTSAYRADTLQITEMLNGARLSYQRAVGEATGATESAHVVRGLADTYWGYWSDDVRPQDAVLELTGKWMSKEDAVSFLIRNLEPNLDRDIAYLLREDINIDALKRGDSLVASQWRSLYPNSAERLLFAKPEHEAPEEKPEK